MIGKTQWDTEHPNPTDINTFGGFRVGRIIKVYDADYVSAGSSSDKKSYGKADIIWLDDVGRVPRSIDVCRPWFSWKRGAGIVFMPEVDDIIVCQTRNNGYPIVIGFLPYKWNDSLDKPVSVEESFVGPMKPLRKGEVLIKASSQADIHLSANGTIKFRAKDITNTEPATSLIEQNCTEQYYSRVKDSDISTVAETIIGYTNTFEGSPKPCGSSLQVYETAAVNYSEESIPLFVSEVNQGSPTSIEFFLYNDTEISDIVNVSTISSSSDNTNKTTYLLKKSQYSLSSSFYYIPADAQGTSLYYKPCNTEKNLIKYTLTLNKSVSVKKGQQIILTALIRTIKGAIRLNSEGDLFLDGRNVMIRSKETSSSLSLKRSGEATLRGVNTIVGNKNGGYLNAGETGVTIQNGFASDPEAVKKEMSDSSSCGYFYLEDGLPLIKMYYEGESCKIKGVSKEDYQAMSIEDKQSVNKATLSQIQDTNTINETTLQEILEGNFPSYAELKAGE